MGSLKLSENNNISVSEYSDNLDRLNDEEDDLRYLYRPVLINYTISLNGVASMADPDSQANVIPILPRIKTKNRVCSPEKVQCAIKAM